MDKQRETLIDEMCGSQFANNDLTDVKHRFAAVTTLDIQCIKPGFEIRTVREEAGSVQNLIG